MDKDRIKTTFPEKQVLSVMNEWYDNENYSKCFPAYGLNILSQIQDELTEQLCMCQDTEIHRLKKMIGFVLDIKYELKKLIPDELRKEVFYAY